MEKSIEKIKKEQNINLDNLKKQFYKKLDAFENQFYEQLEKQVFKEKRNALIKNFIHSLMEKKRLFRSVFETENGSVYFIAKSGQSWRFKKEGELFKEQPCCNKIIFLEPQEAKRFFEFMKEPFFQERLVGLNGPHYIFKKTSLAVGNSPLEIGVESFSPIIFEENEKELKIIGTQLTDKILDQSFSSGIHLGHPIIKIF